MKSSQANEISAFFFSLDLIVKNLKKNFSLVFYFYYLSGKKFYIITVIIVNLKLFFDDWLMRKQITKNLILISFTLKWFKSLFATLKSGYGYIASGQITKQFRLSEEALEMVIGERHCQFAVKFCGRQQYFVGASQGDSIPSASSQPDLFTRHFVSIF